MTPFEYLSVLISIVLGLGVTELLSSARRLVQARERVRFHWLPAAWSGIAFVALVQWWWAAFGMRSRMEWDFLSFLLVLLSPGLLYLAAALVLPDPEPGEPCDLRAYYFGGHRLFFSVAAAEGAVELLRALLARDGQAALLNLGFLALLGSLAVSRSERWHAVGTVLAAALLAAFVLAETFRIT